MSHRPDYIFSINIRCIIKGCSQIVKSNGVPVVSHTELVHKYSAGETAVVCRRCGNAGLADKLTGKDGIWRVKQLVEVKR